MIRIFTRNRNAYSLRHFVTTQNLKNESYDDENQRFLMRSKTPNKKRFKFNKQREIKASKVFETFKPNSECVLNDEHIQEFEMGKNIDSESKNENMKKKLSTAERIDAILTETDNNVQKKINLPKPSHLNKPLRNTMKILKKNIEEIANQLGGNENKTKQELLDAFTSSTDVNSKKSSHVQLSKLLTDMNTSLENPASGEPEPLLGFNHYDSSKLRKKPPKLSNILKSSYPLNIFKKKDLLDQKTESKTELWGYLEKKHMEYLFSSPARNYFQELILWTKQGKLWHFPIDNEQGMFEEMNVDFSEHVFLDKHVQPWCPPAGPIRHFMELVTVGLSKNYSLTVDDKIEHIMWYKNYFEGKKKLLEELNLYHQPEDVTL